MRRISIVVLGVTSASVLAIILAACGSTGTAPSSVDASPEAATGRFGEADASECGGACPATARCMDGRCVDACEHARLKKWSVGCEYFAMSMDNNAISACLAAFVANTFDKPAHLDVAFAGQSVDLGQHAKVPRGAGPALTYEPYAQDAGLAPGDVAILFLAGNCPVPTPSLQGTQLRGTGITKAFRVRSDVPVVAYQMLPYAGGAGANTGATLLLPTSAWDKNYLAVNAYAAAPGTGDPSLDVVAGEDGTTVTLLPKVAVVGGPGVAAAGANTPLSVRLDAGEVLQITQPAELTGSPIAADKPIGHFAGHTCMYVPTTAGACDHGEQQIPPIGALGSEYAAVTHRQRSTVAEKPPWRIIGAVDGTMLTFDPPGVGPSTIGLGQVVELATAEPFVVKSQDANHPFLLFGYMTGWQTVDSGYGDPDFLRITPTDQYLDRYVFFTDPTYPETNLVVVRKKGPAGFADVAIDCAGNLGGWTALGTGGRYEWTRFDLVRHDFEPQGGCNNGRREMTSTQPFGLWVWGWGTPEARQNAVSYAYAAGENLSPLNAVVVPPSPK